mgnify:CR=1 FL=1
MTSLDVTPSPVARLRVRVFVDFWNFTLSMRGCEDQFQIDWKTLGFVLSTEASKLIDPSAAPQYEGLHVYGSYDPSTSKDAKLRNWFSNKLDKMPGVNVILQERQRKKGYPKCPACHVEVSTCPSCGADMRGTEEKGVDTRIVTDMISLAWSDSYNVGVLVSADRDFVPVADFLQTKGIKLIHGAFPPKGSNLSQKCWANLDIPSIRELFRRR